MAEQKFEGALKKLEEIVEGLEQGKISLEDSLKKYEEGINLAKFCTKKLHEAEQKIEMLTKDSKGNLKKEPFAAEEVKPKTRAKKKDNVDTDKFLF